MQGLREGKGEVSLDQNKNQSVDEYICEYHEATLVTHSITCEC